MQAQPGAELPPGLASTKQQTADDVLKAMNKVPLFMTTLDETDEQGGENVALEAIKALAYEGTRAEVAANFKEQGNELARVKKWSDAKEFYDKALAALRGPVRPQEVEEDGSSIDLKPVDEVAERNRERELEEVCHVNRALCHLELKNFRSCNLDCAAALRLNPSNVKALYRSASACLALDKIPEAEDACYRGLDIDPENAALKKLGLKLLERKADLEVAARKRREREEREAADARTLTLALKQRDIKTRTTGRAPDTEDAVIKLADPLDATSTLSFPVILLYPLHLQSDFIKAFHEDDNLTKHLEYILPLPWDDTGEYSPKSVECYMETVSGGLIKAGKKLALREILSNDKLEVLDGIVRVNVVPANRAPQWIEDWKKRRPS